MNKVLLPRLVLEDYMSLSRGLIMAAWVALALAIMTQVAIRASDAFVWPLLGTFPTTYNAVLLEFGVNTLALTALLFYRDWYERVPRESAQRVRWLLVFVIVWFSLHLFAAFHVTGSINGPLLLLLPVLLMAALLVMPGRAGWLLAAYLLLGHLAVLQLESSGWIAARGALGPIFSMSDPDVFPFAWTAMVVVGLVAISLAVAVRQWLYPDANSLSPAQRIDPETGLFRHSFLMHRVSMELGRVQRQGGGAALLLIGQENTDGKQMAVLAEALRRQIRIGSDTPAIYKQGVMAVLLPTTGGDVAKNVASRIVKGVALSEEGTHRLRSAVAIVTNQNIDPDSLLVSVDAALQAAEPGGQPVIVVD